MNEASRAMGPSDTTLSSASAQTRVENKHNEANTRNPYLIVLESATNKNASEAIIRRLNEAGVTDAKSRVISTSPLSFKEDTNKLFDVGRITDLGIFNANSDLNSQGENNILTSFFKNDDICPRLQELNGNLTGRANVWLASMTNAIRNPFKTDRLEDLQPLNFHKDHVFASLAKLVEKSLAAIIEIVQPEANDILKVNKSTIFSPKLQQQVKEKAKPPEGYPSGGYIKTNFNTLAKRGNTALQAAPTLQHPSEVAPAKLEDFYIFVDKIFSINPS